MPPPAPALNDRQRAYLLAVFETDQETEQQVRELPYRPFQPPRPKASEWRWVALTIVATRYSRCGFRATGAPFSAGARTIGACNRIPDYRPWLS
jgi:hypothetical protein